MYGYWYKRLKTSKRCAKHSTTQANKPLKQSLYFFENFSFKPLMFHRFTRNR